VIDVMVVPKPPPHQDIEEATPMSTARATTSRTSWWTPDSSAAEEKL
jgi:hypothetical protein